LYFTTQICQQDVKRKFFYDNRIRLQFSQIGSLTHINPARLREKPAISPAFRPTGGRFGGNIGRQELNIGRQQQDIGRQQQDIGRHSDLSELLAISAQ
jgi:hypothetical protein